MTATIINAATSTSGMGQSAGNDGTLVIQTGATAGAQVNAVVLDATGQATLKQPPKLDATAVVSKVLVTAANGYGSTNTCIRRFTNIVTNTGSDITYADSATLGGSFTINTSGIYAIVYNCNGNASAGYDGISVNTSQPTSQIQTITTANRLGLLQHFAANVPGTISWTGYLSAGDVVRAHNDTNAAGAATVEQFQITKVA